MLLLALVAKSSLSFWYQNLNLVPLKRWAWTVMAKSSSKELIINYCLSLGSQESKGTNGPKVPLWNGEESGALTEECRGEEQLG